MCKYEIQIINLHWHVNAEHWEMFVQQMCKYSMSEYTRLKIMKCTSILYPVNMKYKDVNLHWHVNAEHVKMFVQQMCKYSMSGYRDSRLWNVYCFQYMGKYEKWSCKFSKACKCKAFLYRRWVKISDFHYKTWNV